MYITSSNKINLKEVTEGNWKFGCTVHIVPLSDRGNGAIKNIIRSVNHSGDILELQKVIHEEFFFLDFLDTQKN